MEYGNVHLLTTDATVRHKIARTDDELNLQASQLSMTSEHRWHCDREVTDSGDVTGNVVVAFVSFVLLSVDKLQHKALHESRLAHTRR